MSLFTSSTVSHKMGLGAAVLLLAAGAWMLPACSSTSDADPQTESSGDVLAVVGGADVTRADVEAEASEDLKKVEMQKLQCESSYQRSKHEVLTGVLERVVRDQLLDAEAEAQGITRDELLEKEVNSKIAGISDADIDTFYNQNQAQIRQPKENVAGQIRQYLEREKEQESYDTYIASLEAKSEVDYRLGPYRVQLETAGFPAKGPENAPVTIVEFSDFECPYCSRVVPTLKQVEENYGDKVRFVFRQFPLDFHQQAQKAAEAALCAGDQDKFWDMHGLLFEEQRELQVAQLKDKATRLELNADKFNECLDSGKYAQTVKDDVQAGVLAGVSGTPSMFINGRFLSGAQPYENIIAIIDEELESAGAAE
ncbi:MAG: thioredoxin domain-containing protein [Acidobacteriota bacterium]